MKNLYFITFFLLLTHKNLMASVPSVATDILPVHSLVSIVMDGLGKPSVIISGNASPHDHSLRPSEARDLQNADIVFWTSSELTPWLERRINSLAQKAVSIELLEVEGVKKLHYRQNARFEHDHHDDEHHDDEHQNETKTEDDHSDHEGYDPHMWLDPVAAKVWLKTIAEKLSEIDPDRSVYYLDNAERGISGIDSLINEVNNNFNNKEIKNFIVFHDAYHYFENRFNVFATGAISLSDSRRPSPQRIKEVQKTIKELKVQCVFTEPQFDPD